MPYCTINRAVIDYDIDDLGRMCTLRLWHDWAAIAAFTWRECGKIVGLAVHAEIRTGGVQKVKYRSVSARASLLAAHFAVEYNS
jgi:hypothetical protein